MMGGWRQFLLAVVLIAVFPAVSSAEEASAGIDPSLVIEQFDVFNDGDWLLVPVDIGGKTYSFWVDTGCTASVYDKSLRSLLGKAKGTKQAGTPSGALRVELYDPPHARLGKVNLRTEMPITCLDLQKMREVSGHDFYGVIGMDVLGDHVIRLDSDHKKLMILRSPGLVVGDALPLTYSKQLPLVPIEIPSCGKQLFVIDTGFASRGSGSLDALTFEYSVASGVGKQVAKTLFADARGTTSSRQVLLESLSYGKCECRKLIMDQSKERRLLSLRFMTRFNATFDFPKNLLYLEKSRHFDRPDRFDLSGLHFLRRDGQVVVEVVDDGSPAALGGIKADDIIVSVNGDDASKARLFSVRETLSLPGTSVHVELKRGDERFDVELKLPGEKSDAEREIVGQ